MLSTSDILFGVLLPLVFAVAVLTTARLTKINGRLAGPLAIGGAFSLAFACVEGFGHVLAPASAEPWLFYVGLFFTVMGLLDATVKTPWWLRASVVLLATVAAASVVLKFNFSNQTWDAAHGAIWLGGIGVVGVIWWACFEGVAIEGAVLMPIGAMLICAIAGLVAMLVADQTVGQALGAIGVALAGTAVVAGWFGNISLARGTAAVIAGVGVCALAAAYFVSNVPIVDLALVGFAPILLAMSIRIPMSALPSGVRTIIRVVVTSIPLGIALTLAAAQFRREAAERSADPYSMGSVSSPLISESECYASSQLYVENDPS